MEKIEIGEGCFGPHVLIDGEPLFIEEIGKRNDLKRKLIEKLGSLLDEMDMRDFLTIAEIVISRGRYEWIEGDSYSDTCDQCGNYNYGETYVLIK